jgi:UDP-glucose 4-epimerase
MGMYLVTGGAGFIGSHLVEHLLAEGHDVRVLDDLSTGKRTNLPADVELVVGDIRDAKAVREAMDGAVGCFHLAAIASVQASTDDWAGAHSVNVSGSVVVFDAAVRANNVPVVYASSAAVYGDNDATPLREDEVARPMTAYAADKYGCELHAKVGARISGLRSAGMRFFNVFGPRQDPKSPYSGVISIFADRLANRRGVTINGDGSQTRDFVYVGDVCEALYRAMRAERTGAEVFNVCTGRETSVLQLANQLERLLGAPSRIEFGPARAGDIMRSLGNPERMQERLGFTPSTSLQVGLERTLESLLESARSNGLRL